MPHHCKVRVAVCETNVYVCVGCRYKIVRIKNKEMVGQKKCWIWCRTATTAVKGAVRCCREGWVKQVSKHRVSTYPDMLINSRPTKVYTYGARTSTYEYSRILREYLRERPLSTLLQDGKKTCAFLQQQYGRNQILLSH